MERQAEAYFKRIDEIGGVIPAIEVGFFQKEIADAAFRYQKELELKRRIVVGVNDFTVDEEEPIDILRIDPRLESRRRSVCETCPASATQPGAPMVSQG